MKRRIAEAFLLSHNESWIMIKDFINIKTIHKFAWNWLGSVKMSVPSKSDLGLPWIDEYQVSVPYRDSCLITNPSHKLPGGQEGTTLSCHLGQVLWILIGFIRLKKKSRYHCPCHPMCIFLDPPLLPGKEKKYYVKDIFEFNHNLVTIWRKLFLLLGSDARFLKENMWITASELNWTTFMPLNLQKDYFYFQTPPLLSAECVHVAEIQLGYSTVTMVTFHTTKVSMECNQIPSPP